MPPGASSSEQVLYTASNVDVSKKPAKKIVQDRGPARLKVKIALSTRSLRGFLYVRFD